MTARLLVLHVNGIEYELQARVTATLAEVLREELGLTGTKLCVMKVIAVPVQCC